MRAQLGALGEGSTLKTPAMRSEIFISKIKHVPMLKKEILKSFSNINTDSKMIYSDFGGGHKVPATRFISVMHTQIRVNRSVVKDKYEYHCQILSV